MGERTPGDGAWLHKGALQHGWPSEQSRHPAPPALRRANYLPLDLLETRVEQ